MANIRLLSARSRLPRKQKVAGRISVNVVPDNCTSSDNSLTTILKHITGNTYRAKQARTKIYIKRQTAEPRFESTKTPLTTKRYEGATKTPLTTKRYDNIATQTKTIHTMQNTAMFALLPKSQPQLVRVEGRLRIERNQQYATLVGAYGTLTTEI